MRTIRDNQGFTLIELMIVVVIIGILAAIAIPRFTQVSVSAKQAEAGPILKQMCSLAVAQKMKAGTFPTDIATAGFESPAAKYFSFSWNGTTGVATAVAGGGSLGTQAGLVNETLTCEPAPTTT